MAGTFYREHKGWKFIRTDHLFPGNGVIAVKGDVIIGQPFNPSVNDAQFHVANNSVQDAVDALESPLGSREPDTPEEEEVSQDDTDGFGLWKSDVDSDIEELMEIEVELEDNGDSEDGDE